MNKPTWTEETMMMINNMTPNISGKAFDIDWLLLRLRFEEAEDRIAQLEARIKELEAGLITSSAYVKII